MIENANLFYLLKWIQQDRLKITDNPIFSSMHGHEDLLVQLIATHGPVAVSVDATSWNNYQGGIIQYHCGTRYNNHAVEIIGYDKTGKADEVINSLAAGRLEWNFRYRQISNMRRNKPQNLNVSRLV